MDRGTNQQRIAEWLDSFGCLTTSQVYRLAGLPGVLDKHHPGQRSLRFTLHDGARRNHRRPALWAEASVFGSVGERVYFPKSERRPNSLVHELEINEIRLAFGSPRFWVRRGLAHDGVNPDYLTYAFSCFIFGEHDRQKNSLRKRSGSVQKCARYARLRESRRFAAFHRNMQDFLVVVTVLDERRRDNLVSMLRKSGLAFGMFRVATLEDASQRPHEPVWHAPNGSVYRFE